MKLAKLPSWVATVTLLLGVVGCRKGLDKTTHIPGHGQPPITEAAAPPRDIDRGNTLPANPANAAQNVTGVDATKGPGIAQTSRNFDDWTANRDEFRAQTVYFDYDKSIVRPGEVGKLEEVARRMKSSFQGKALRIEGHCDERGTEEYNRALGDRRALSVREKLVSLGLDPEMLATITFGEEKPADPGHNEAAWSKNRRAELVLLSPP